LEKPKKSIYRQLRALIAAAFTRPGFTIEPTVMVAYIDPLNSGGALKDALKSKSDSADSLFDAAESLPVPNDIGGDDDNLSLSAGTKPALIATSAQAEHYNQVREQKPYRKQLQLLVVEDQIFSQKLLCEILRSARVKNNNETPMIDAVSGIHDAWKTYLKKVPDLTFIDLGLADGSGHTLARAIKELDPTSYVVIVTANNYEEELSVARQNNVDGFISKPYTKKQIFDCIERYVGGSKTHVKGGARGLTGQF
jgi:CheY-like chemotaxis protein